MSGLHDDRCATHKGFPCNCPSAAFGVKRYVLRTNENTRDIKRLELTDELCAEIARFNGYLQADAVKSALLRGQSVYTNFSYYKLES